MLKNKSKSQVTNFRTLNENLFLRGFNFFQVSNKFRRLSFKMNIQKCAQTLSLTIFWNFPKNPTLFMVKLQFTGEAQK